MLRYAAGRSPCSSNRLASAQVRSGRVERKTKQTSSALDTFIALPQIHVQASHTDTVHHRCAVVLSYRHHFCTRNCLSSIPCCITPVGQHLYSTTHPARTWILRPCRSPIQRRSAAIDKESGFPPATGMNKSTSRRNSAIVAPVRLNLGFNSERVVVAKSICSRNYSYRVIGWMDGQKEQEI